MKNKAHLFFSMIFIVTFLSLLVSAGSQAEDQIEESGKIQKADYSDPAELLSLIEEQKSSYFLIDVRTEEEYASGHIPTAINIPLDIIADNLPTENREALIIVYCKSGRRSSMAAETLINLGFSNVVDFGGIVNWRGELSY